jgi:hypothetical protein
MASDRPEDVALGFDSSTAGIVGLVHAPDHAGPALAREQDDRSLAAGVQVAAAMVLGVKGIEVRKQGHAGISGMYFSPHVTERQRAPRFRAALSWD